MGFTSRLRNVLAVAQIAIAMILLIGAGSDGEELLGARAHRAGVSFGETS